MSAPARGGPPGEPDARASSLAPRWRWIDALSGVLLFAAVIAAGVAAMPALLRAVGVPLPSAAAPSFAPTIDVRYQPPEILRDPDKLLDPDRDLDPDDAPFAAPQSHGQLGLARVATTLRDRPADGGKQVGEIKAGELVMILQESGDWLQVWASGADSVAMGWVKKSGIAVR